MKRVAHNSANRRRGASLWCNNTIISLEDLSSLLFEKHGNGVNCVAICADGPDLHTAVWLPIAHEGRDHPAASAGLRKKPNL